MRTLITALAPLAAPFAVHVQTDGPVGPAEAVLYQGEAGFNQPATLRPRAVVPLIDILKPTPADH